MRSLSDLVQHILRDVTLEQCDDSLTISGISADSRKIQAGFIFAALKGQHVDGAVFIKAAKEHGAVAVLCDAECNADMHGMAVIRAQNPTRVLAILASQFYAPQPEFMAAVTGTDGKTSTADFCRMMWHEAGLASASVGTLGMIAGDGEVLMPGTHTTPQPVELHQALQMIAQKEIAHVCMEASSHGLDQHRLDGVQLKAAAFTNFGRDHLDYHHTIEAYFLAKMRLFSDLLPRGCNAILPKEEPRFDVMKAACDKAGHNVLTFGREGADFALQKLTPLPHGQHAALRIHGMDYEVDVPLVGEFQVMNILCALGLVTSLGLSVDKALATIPRLKGVPGRLEQAVQLQNGAAVYVDYAHTPLALANILRTLRPHTRNDLHLVFGCGGDRDPGKRTEMGRIAQQLADVVTVTDDNPRSESPDMIRKAIVMACPDATELGDRAAAIRFAISKLEEGDVLVIAGKGHETYQIVGDQTLSFDDRVAARDAARELNVAA